MIVNERMSQVHVAVGGLVKLDVCYHVKKEYYDIEK